jgi:hypothetical protein
VEDFATKGELDLLARLHTNYAWSRRQICRAVYSRTDMATIEELSTELIKVIPVILMAKQNSFYWREIM